MFAIRKLSDKQFRQYCDLVYREAGIHLTDEKRELLNARLAKRLRVMQVDAGAYFKIIVEDREELSRFLDAISTNHLFFPGIEKLPAPQRRHAENLVRGVLQR